MLLVEPYLVYIARELILNGKTPSQRRQKPLTGPHYFSTPEKYEIEVISLVFAAQGLGLGQAMIPFPLKRPSD